VSARGLNFIICSYLLIFLGCAGTPIKNTDASWSNITSKLSSPADIALVTQSLMNKPYIMWPTGEGPSGEIHTAPLYRFDGFDCVSFVETALALSCSYSFESFKSNLSKIRYSSSPNTFFSRNHFHESDWLPHNIAKNGLTDFTETRFKKIKTIIDTIDKPNWFRSFRLSNIVKPSEAERLSVAKEKILFYANNSKPIDFTLPYFPIASENDIMTANSGLVHGDLLHFVWKTNSGKLSNSGTNYYIHHLGFIVKNNGVIFLRSASLSKSNRAVVNVIFKDYLDDLVKNPDFLGINVTRLNSCERLNL
jgi:hypothetical protein